MGDPARWITGRIACTPSGRAVAFGRMKPFGFKQGSSDWPAGTTLLHVYAIPDMQRNRELAALVEGCRAAADVFPLAWVEDPWLHLTLAQVPDSPADRIPQDDRDALVAALGARLERLKSLRVLIGSPLSYHSGVICDVHPDGPLVRLCEAAQEAVTAARGDGADSYEVGVPHLSLAYATQPASSDDVQRRLRRVRPSHAPLDIDAVHLVDVTADDARKTITWDHLAVIPLGGPKSAEGG